MPVDAFRDLYGAVYIFENSEAQRVKVGMTLNNVGGRLEDINYMWHEIRVTCQICGGRRLIGNSGRIPQHVLSGTRCPGGDALPLERDVGLAQSHLQNLKTQVNELAGSEKGSVVRKIRTLERRIALYQQHARPVGVWQFRTAFYTKSAERVELLTHHILGERLDRLAPFGEVFCCSVPEATAAVEAALSQLGLLNSVKKQSER
jgi:hypothetical protein